MSKIQFRRSAVVLAVSMMAAGGAFADPITGNTLVGPAITSGAATVNINQVGVGNVVSADGQVTGDAFIVNTGTGALTLTIQQVDKSSTGGNTLGLNAHTNNATTKIRVFQGGEAAGPGGTGGVVNVTKDIGVDGDSTENVAAITLGTSLEKADASEILLSQQGSTNTAALTLGSAAFQGVMQVVQKGDTNSAVVIVSGQTTSQTFNIGQVGDSNYLFLNAVDMGGAVTANFSGVDFAGLANTSNPNATGTIGGNNAATYSFTTANGVTGSSLSGINLGSTAGFNLQANGGSNNVQVDLSTADTSSKVDVALAGSNNLAIYGSESTINVGGTTQVAVGSGKTLAVYAANSSTVSINGVTFGGNGYFSSTSESNISVTGGTVTEDGMSILQTDGAHQATITGTGGSATWNITQSGADVKTAMLTNTGAGADWTVAQSGAGAMTLGMTNTTAAGVINVSQTGAADHSAIGINFAAGSGSFTLAQK